MFAPLVFCTSTFRISARQTDSLSELESCLQSKGGTSYLVKRGEGHRRYYLISFEAMDRAWSASVGLALSLPAITPTLIEIPGSSNWALGFDDRIAVIPLLEGSEPRIVELAGAFFDFLPYMERQLVAIHELGITCISSDGAVTSEFEASDIVTSWQTRGSAIVLTLQDGTTMEFSMDH